MPGGVAALIGSFGARLGMDETDYVRGVLNAEAATRVFGGTFATFLSNPLLASIDLIKRWATSVGDLAGKTLDAAEIVSIFARSVNASTDFVQGLKAQYEAAGRSFEEAQPTLLKVVEALDQARRTGGPAADALRQIGVSLEGVTSTDDALRRIIDGLAGVEDPSRRAALAMELLGAKSGPDLVAVIGATSGAVDAMIDRARRLGLVMDQDTIAAIGRFDDTLDSVQQTIGGLQQSLIADFLAGFSGGDIDDAAESIQELARTMRDDLGPALKDVGEFARTLLDIFIELKPLFELSTSHLSNVASAWSLGLNAVTGGSNPRGAVRALGRIESFGIDVGGTLDRLAPGAGGAYDLVRLGVGTP